MKILDPEGGLDPRKLYFTAKVMIYLQRGLKQDPSPQMGKSLQKKCHYFIRNIMLVANFMSYTYMPFELTIHS